MEGFYVMWERHPCTRGASLHPKNTPVPREHPGRMTKTMKNLKISSKSKSPNFLSSFSFLSSSSCSSPFSSLLPSASLLLAQLKLLLLHYLRLLQLPLLFFFFCNHYCKPTTMPWGIINNHPALPTNSSTPNSSATIQVPETQLQPTMTQEQTNLIFDLTRQKLEADLAAAELDARVRRVAVEEEAKLRRELMVKESEARIAAAVAAATAPMAASQRKSLTEEDDITGKVPPEVMSITLHFAGLPQEEIIRILHNKFKSINFYRLRHIWGLRFDSMQDHDRVGIEDGMFKLWKTSRTYKDFRGLFMRCERMPSIITRLSLSFSLAKRP